MEAWLAVWLVVVLVTTVALLVMLAFLVRHVILLGRTAGRMQEELQPIADEVAAASARAGGATAIDPGMAARAADTASRFSERASPHGASSRRRGPR